MCRTGCVVIVEQTILHSLLITVFYDIIIIIIIKVLTEIYGRLNTSLVRSVARAILFRRCVPG